MSCADAKSRNPQRIFFVPSEKPGQRMILRTVINEKVRPAELLVRMRFIWHASQKQKHMRSRRAKSRIAAVSGSVREAVLSFGRCKVQALVLWSRAFRNSRPAIGEAKIFRKRRTKRIPINLSSLTLRGAKHPFRGIPEAMARFSLTSRRVEDSFL